MLRNVSDDHPLPRQPVLNMLHTRYELLGQAIEERGFFTPSRWCCIQSSAWIGILRHPAIELLLRSMHVSRWKEPKRNNDL